MVNTSKNPEICLSFTYLSLTGYWAFSLSRDTGPDDTTHLQIFGYNYFHFSSISEFEVSIGVSFEVLQERVLKDFILEGISHEDHSSALISTYFAL